MRIAGIRAGELRSQRLHLEPLRVEDAVEMAALLDDVDLHAFIGGQPATPEELRHRYELMVTGRSPDGWEIWLNWIVRRTDDGQAVGTVQATVTVLDGHPTADIAWVIATAHQRRGYAREAARAMVDWLRERQVDVVVAFVHPGHKASQAVARAVGLAPTNVVADGEVRWLG